jgi:hypothetical protein
MVRNDRRTRLLPKIILGQLFVTLIIVLVSLSVVFYTQGYRFNYRSMKVVKTGVLYFSFQPRDVSITINSQTFKASSNLAKNYPPGFYNISIKKDGYTSWDLRLKVEPSSVNDYKNIILFKSDIKTAVLSDQNKIDLLNAPIDTLATNAPDQLRINGYELWSGDRLVSRFSVPIINATWYPDLNHIIYQSEDEIRVIEVSGQNDILLVKLSSNQKTNIAIGARGTELYYKDLDQYKIATIR